MALADRIAPASIGGVPCKTCVLLSGGLNDEDAATLRSWLEDDDVSPHRIAGALRAEGHSVSHGSIKRHRVNHR